MTKAPTPTEKSKKQRDNTKTPLTTSITQRLRTDLGRSVGVMIATQLVWLNQFSGSHPSEPSETNTIFGLLNLLSYLLGRLEFEYFSGIV